MITVHDKKNGLSRIKKRKHVIFFLTNKARSLHGYIMKTINRKLTAETGTEAKVKLMELQAELIKAGCGARSVSPGKIVAELILMEGAVEYLKTKLRPEQA